MVIVVIPLVIKSKFLLRCKKVQMSKSLFLQKLFLQKIKA